MSITGDGVFILNTKHPLRDFEYRVAHSDDIGTIYGKFDDATKRWKINSKNLWETFRFASVYDNLPEAMEHAKAQMARLGTETECGIMVVSLRNNTWDELINLDIPKE